MRDCIEWQGSRGRDGYGLVTVARVNGKKRRSAASRAAWIKAFGPIPDGLCVLHRCDNPPCVKLEHLFLGTVAENNRDRAAKGRSAHNRNPHQGELNGRAILTKADVLEIRNLHRVFGHRLGRKHVAESFGVSLPTVDAILSGRNWKGVMP